MDSTPLNKESICLFITLAQRITISEPNDKCWIRPINRMMIRISSRQADCLLDWLSDQLIERLIDRLMIDYAYQTNTTIPSIESQSRYCIMPQSDSLLIANDNNQLLSAGNCNHRTNSSTKNQRYNEHLEKSARTLWAQQNIDIGKEPKFRSAGVCGWKLIELNWRWSRVLCR